MHVVIYSSEYSVFPSLCRLLPIRGGFGLFPALKLIQEEVSIVLIDEVLLCQTDLGKALREAAPLLHHTVQVTAA